MITRDILALLDTIAQLLDQQTHQHPALLELIEIKLVLIVSINAGHVLKDISVMQVQPLTHLVMLVTSVLMVQVSKRRVHLDITVQPSQANNWCVLKDISVQTTEPIFTQSVAMAPIVVLVKHLKLTVQMATSELVSLGTTTKV